MDIEIFLYKATSKHTYPEKYELSVDKHFSISENDFIYLEILSSSKFDSQNFIWLSDFRFDLFYKGEFDNKFTYGIMLDGFFGFSELEKFTENFKIENSTERFYKLFLNNYGLCEIEIEIDPYDGNKPILKGIIDVQSKKIDEVDYLLDYLFEKDVYYWSSISLTKSKAKDNSKTKENILWVLNNLKEISTIFHDVYIPNIITDKISRLSPIYKVSEWNDEVCITDESFTWLMSNVDKVENASYIDENKFLLLNRYYKTSEIYSESLIEDTNVYENQLIHGFIKQIARFLNTSLDLIHVEMKKFSNEFDFSSRVYINYFRRLITEINQIQKSFNNIKSLLDDTIPVLREEFVLSSTHRFNSKNHYFILYQNLIQWLERKEAYYSPEQLFAGTNDISKLYELFCLHKLMDCIKIDLCYEKVENIDNIANPYKSSAAFFDTEKKSIYSLYSFVKGNTRINLYYELLPDSLTTTAKSYSRGFRPDFILEITKSNQSPSYVILDAKYKRIEIIENHDYQQLALKYLHGIGPKIGGFFNVLGLLVMNPISGSAINYYQRSTFSLSGETPTFPIIGRLELNVYNQNEKYLCDTLKSFLHYA